jgi:hypothetical protein
VADEKNTQFNYLLNAFELASKAERPVDHGYRDKRVALIAHVRELERKAAAFEALRDLLREVRKINDVLLPDDFDARAVRNADAAVAAACACGAYGGPESHAKWCRYAAGLKEGGDAHQP